MKKVIAILALLSLTGNIASAELLKNFKYDGKIEVNTHQVRNVAYNDATKDKGNDTDTRVQINMGFDLNDDADAVVSIVKADRQYGDGAQNVENITDLLFVEQAYLNLKGVLGLDHKLGRQYYGEEGDINMYYGPTSWPYAYGGYSTNGMTRAALDAWTSGYSWDKLHMGFMLGTAVNDAAATPDQDEDVAAITAKYDLSDDMNLGGYYLHYTQQEGATAGKAIKLNTIGAKLTGKAMGFNYGAEVAKNMGSYNETLAGTPGWVTGAAAANTADFTGMAMKFNASYDMEIAGNLSLMGEFATGTGDDNTANDEVEQFIDINGDYRPGILWGGNYLGGVAGNTPSLNNLTTWNVGAKWAPEAYEKLTLTGKLLNFSPTEDVTAWGYDEYGMEFDLCANWQHSENVSVKAYYAMFMPDKEYVDYTNDTTNNGNGTDDATSLIGAAFTVKF